ncbi:MAG: hypothetical protein M1457_04745, partial [bacterium]|nr:hypothetical protein [bacterium]
LAALMRLDGKAGLPFVARWLEVETPAVAEGAALAIGESRAPGAFDRLRGAWERAMGDGERRRSLLVPIALVRDEASFAFLMEVIESGDPRTAEAAAAAALQIHEADAPHRRRIDAARRARR